jgi:hypothetical protein
LHSNVNDNYNKMMIKSYIFLPLLLSFDRMSTQSFGSFLYQIYHLQFPIENYPKYIPKEKLPSNFSTLQILTRVLPRSLHFDLSLFALHRFIELEFPLFYQKYSKSTNLITHMTSTSNRKEVQKATFSFSLEISILNA